MRREARVIDCFMLFGRWRRVAGQGLGQAPVYFHQWAVCSQNCTAHFYRRTDSGETPPTGRVNVAHSHLARLQGRTCRAHDIDFFICFITDCNHALSRREAREGFYNRPRNCHGNAAWPGLAVTHVFIFVFYRASALRNLGTVAASKLPGAL